MSQFISELDTNNPLTKTAAFATASAQALDISGLAATTDWTLHLEVMNQSCASGTVGAVFQFETSVDAFTTPIPGPNFEVRGTVVAGASIHKTWRSREYKDLGAAIATFGTASSRLRLNLKYLLGTSPTITYRAWIEY